VIWIISALTALGWYESTFWGIAILQRTTRPTWRFPRHAFALMVGPILPIVAVVRRIGAARGPVSKGLLLLAGLSAIVWIGAWVAIIQFFLFESFVAMYVMADEGWFTFMARDPRWVAVLSWFADPWFQLTWRAALFMDTGIMMPLLWLMADLGVKVNVDLDIKRAAYLFGRRRRSASRLPLYLVKVRGEAGETD
jgi:hypothetical protein